MAELSRLYAEMLCKQNSRNLCMPKSNTVVYESSVLTFFKSMLDQWKNKQSWALEHNFCEKEPEIARLFYLGLNINKILWCFPQPTSNSRNHKLAFVSLVLLKWIIHGICKRNITQKSQISVDFQSTDAMGRKSSLQFSAICLLFHYIRV